MATDWLKVYDNFRESEKYFPDAIGCTVALMMRDCKIGKEEAEKRLSQLRNDRTRARNRQVV